MPSDISVPSCGPLSPSGTFSHWLQVDTRRLVARSAGICLLLAFWFFCNPFFEIDRSSLIYTGRMLADLDPTGIGRDMMFRLDGQSGFTIFTFIYREAATAFGTVTATLLISLSSVAASFVGVYLLASTVCLDRARPLAIVFAATLPACYGGFKVFSFAETAATPRPFAEALVLCAIVALLREKHWLAIALVLGAAILHPIMAMPGLFVVMVCTIAIDRRWLIAVAAAAVVVLIGALLHASMLERLTVIVDPAWKAVLVDRNPQLFPTLWPEGWLGRMAVRIATLLLGASLAPPRVRNLYLVTCAVGLVGFGTAYWLTARWPIVILVQAQTWRTMWLVFALATIAAATCTIELWRLGPAGRIALALLALGWVFADQDLSAILFAAAAIGSRFALNEQSDVLSKRATTILLVSAAFIGAVGLIKTEVGIAGLIGDARADVALSILNLNWDYTPLAFLAGCFGLMWRHQLQNWRLAGILACTVVLAGATWDRRSDETLTFDAGVAVPDLVRRVATKEGEVFWLGGTRESWLWLHRPQWLSGIQGAGLVFSRQLALRYHDRAQRAVEAGLDNGGILNPWADRLEDLTQLDVGKVKAFCSVADAPAWIIAPVHLDREAANRLGATSWTAPVSKLSPKIEPEGKVTWQPVSDYSVIPCAYTRPRP